MKNGTSPETAILNLVGEDSAPYYPCRDEVTVKPGNENKCALSTFMQNLVDGALTEPLAGAADTALDFSTHIEYVNAITGETQWIKMDLRLWDEPTSEGDPSSLDCTHACNDFSALEPHFSETVCDTADFVLSGFDTILSGLGALVGQDLIVTLAIRLNNIFAFKLSVDYITLTIKYDDPDGVDNWIVNTLTGGPYAAGYDLMLIDNAGITVSPPYSLEPGEREFSANQNVNAGALSGELLGRIYDEVVSKGRLCIHLFLSLDILIGDNSGGEDFAVTIPLEIKHLSTLGLTDCTNTGACEPTLTQIVDVTSFSDSQWQRVGDAKYSSGQLVINSYDDAGWFESTVGAAWYKSKIFVENSFEVSIQFRGDNGALAASEGFTFTIQNDKYNAIGTHSSSTGWGARGITKSISVGVDVWGTNEVEIFTNGSPAADDWSFSSSGNFDDGNWHTMLIRYNHITFIMSLFIDDMSNALTDMEIDLSSVLETNDGKAWVGVTAAGGGTNRMEFLIREFTYSVAKTDITKSIMVGNGLVAATMSNGVGNGAFNIVARTSCSVEQRRGEDVWNIELECTNNANCPAARILATNIADNSDGTYTVSFSVTSAGTWRVHVSLPNEDASAQHEIGYFLVV